jgi:glycosyltransferase involved in cell wall biosynthesis
MTRRKSDRDWIVAQIGARQHYAVARAMHQRDRLHQLYTDAWCARGRTLLQALPDPVRSLANRYHPALPRHLVTAFTAQAIKDRLRWRLLRPNSDHARYQHHVEVGRTFASNIVADLRRTIDDPGDYVFFGYDTGCYEVLDWFEGTDGFTILDQIDPGRVEKQIVLEENERWPGWAEYVPVLHPPHYERIEAEWELASVVMVNSEWSRQALVQQGVPEDKIEIIPIAYEPQIDLSPEDLQTSSDRDDFRVLWLGTVILRKGIPYLLKAAEQLQGSGVQVDVVGPIGITEDAVRSAPGNVTFHGSVPRDEVSRWYRRADVFVLPTLSDGFAITQLEAMAHGLPVIATPNCGRVVDHGENGLVVPTRDADRLAEAISTLASDRSRLREMRRKALASLAPYRLSRVGDQLIDMAHTRTTQAEARRQP